MITIEQYQTRVSKGNAIQYCVTFYEFVILKQNRQSWFEYCL